MQREVLGATFACWWLPFEHLWYVLFKQTSIFISFTQVQTRRVQCMKHCCLGVEYAEDPWTAESESLSQKFLLYWRGNLSMIPDTVPNLHSSILWHPREPADKSRLLPGTHKVDTVVWLSSWRLSFQNWELLQFRTEDASGCESAMRG